MNEGVKRIYSEMEKLFLKKPQYSEPNFNVLLVLENNVLNRNLRISEKIKKEISSKKFDKLSSDEILILHYMYNSGENLNTKKTAELLNKGATHSRNLLKKLESEEILKWNGTSKNDSTQYYSLNF